MFSKREEGRAVVWSCHLNITAENFLDFKEQYREAVVSVPEGTAFILDLSEVDHLVSSAIGLIAASYPELRKKYVAFRIVARSKELIRLLKVTRLSKVVRTSSCVKSAIAGLE